MDKQARGELLVKKEELEKQIDTLRIQLRKLGEYLVSFGDAVRRHPENVIFSSAPSGLVGKRGHS